MKGITKIILNQETVEAAVQDYFRKCFDASQLATVTKIEPKDDYGKWTYTVTIDSGLSAACKAEEEHEGA